MNKLISRIKNTEALLKGSKVAILLLLASATAAFGTFYLQNEQRNVGNKKQAVEQSTVELIEEEFTIEEMYPDGSVLQTKFVIKYPNSLEHKTLEGGVPYLTNGDINIYFSDISETNIVGSIYDSVVAEIREKIFLNEREWEKHVKRPFLCTRILNTRRGIWRVAFSG